MPKQLVYIAVEAYVPAAAAQLPRRTRPGPPRRS